jgi:tetratricopeptide (TPR) repeat protein
MRTTPFRAALAAALMAAPAALGNAPAAAPREVLPFIADDYPKALAAAKAAGKPIFFEAWAPWCHTCRSMRAFVFTDKALGRQAGRFVWLSINTEKRENAALLAKYPVKVWPSFFVIDPTAEKVVFRYVGGATTPQMLRVLDDGEKAFRGTAGAALAEADRLYAEGKYAEAAPAYRKALETIKPEAPSYTRAVESLLFALSSAGRREECAAVARDAYPHLKVSPSAAGVAGSGLDCALGMKDDDPKKAELVAANAAFAKEVVAGPKTGLAADDVSAVFGSLADERDAAKDEAGAKKFLEEWAAYLEGEAAKAKTPAERTVFDAHRTSVCVALGQPERVVPALLLSEKDFPDDYNPPQRLAIAYGTMKKYDDALAASDRAMARAYGPRKLVVYRTRVDLYTKKGNAAAAKRTLGEMLAYAEGLPKEQVGDRTIAAIRKQLEAAN